jgi:hypothetical protein
LVLVIVNLDDVTDDAGNAECAQSFRADPSVVICQPQSCSQQWKPGAGE